MEKRRQSGEGPDTYDRVRKRKKGWNFNPHSGVSPREDVDTYVKATELAVDNQMLGVSNSARIRRAAKKTGDSNIYDAQGRFEYLKKTKAQKAKRKRDMAKTLKHTSKKRKKLPSWSEFADMNYAGKRRRGVK